MHYISTVSNSVIIIVILPFLFFSHPPASKISNVISVPIYPEKDIPSELQIKAYVGSPSSSQLHVFEAVRLLPRFSLYVPCGLDISPSPQGSVVFNLPERLDRVRILWCHLIVEKYIFYWKERCLKYKAVGEGGLFFDETFIFFCNSTIFYL